MIAEKAAAGKPALGVRVLRTHSPKTRPASKMELQRARPERSRNGPRHNVALCAMRKAALSAALAAA